MKIQMRSILFALVLPVAACGGGDETPTVDFRLEDYVQLPKSDAQGPVSTKVDVVETPVAVEIVKPMPTKYDELIVEGKDLVSKGKFGDAKVMFDAAIKLDKKQAEPHIELARMYIEMKEKGLAVASANKAVKLAPQSSQAWNTKGRAELNAHKYDEAIEAFTKSVELNPENVFAWNNLGYTELLLKHYEAAAEHLIEATTRTGATGYMFNNLGTALEHLDKLDEARLAYDAGGKLGSVAAASSRKRLEGVDSIVIATEESEVHDQVRAEAPKSKGAMEYELNEGEEEVEEVVEVVEEEVEEEVEEVSDGSNASEELETEDSEPDSSDHSTM